MDKLLKEIASEFKVKFLCTNDTIATIKGYSNEIIDWHNQQMQLAYEKGREDENQEIAKELEEIQTAHKNNGFARLSYIDTLIEKLTQT